MTAHVQPLRRQGKASGSRRLAWIARRTAVEWFLGHSHEIHDDVGLDPPAILDELRFVVHTETDPTPTPFVNCYDSCDFSWDSFTLLHLCALTYTARHLAALGQCPSK